MPFGTHICLIYLHNILFKSPKFLFISNFAWQQQNVVLELASALDLAHDWRLNGGESVNMLYVHYVFCDLFRTRGTGGMWRSIVKMIQ